MRSTIFEYVKKPNKGRVGILFARESNGKIHFGWSLCATNRGDRFLVNQGITDASERCCDPPPIPPSLERQVIRFRARCARYFQQATILFPIQVAAAPIMPKKVRAPKPQRIHKTLQEWEDEKAQASVS